MKSSFRYGSWEFQSTRPRGARLGLVVLAQLVEVVSIHAPTWGATQAAEAMRADVRFNPRAHVGRDIDQVALVDEYLVFQSTRPRGARLLTYFNVLRHSLFQSTRPRGARHIRQHVGVHADVFQSTRPRGARRCVTCARICRRCFNPRAHVGRDTKEVNMTETENEFQSTRPRGARQLRRLTSCR